jgi:hypothetical protein
MFKDDFFDLSSGLMSETVQKLADAGFRFAIFGDFSGDTSKPLRDFIYESDRGRHLFFAADENEALKRLEELTNDAQS